LHAAPPPALKAIAGFIRPAEGEIRLDGQRVGAPGPDRLLVFQEFDQLPPWKTVIENVMFPLVVTGRLKRRAARDEARHVLSKVGLGKFLDAYPHTLSGGMKQRVALAREPALLTGDDRRRKLTPPPIPPLLRYAPQLRAWRRRSSRSDGVNIARR
jgi:ABC-type nitrate/sulfonate/bicarbonate transport system ATPase subunit